MRHKRQIPYIVSAIFILTILLITTLLVVSADISKLDQTKLSFYFSFASAIGALTATALSLISIACSIKEPDIRISLGKKESSNHGTLQAISIRNKGNVAGNMASAFVEIEVSSSSPISFSGAKGLDFIQTPNTEHKQYRFDDPMSPRILYPGKDIWSLLGSIKVPQGFSKSVTFSVNISGSQGVVKETFTINS